MRIMPVFSVILILTEALIILSASAWCIFKYSQLENAFDGIEGVTSINILKISHHIVLIGLICGVLLPSIYFG